MVSPSRLKYSCHPRSYKDLLHSLLPSIFVSSFFYRDLISALTLIFFQGWYVNGSRPATACSRDVSEHVHVAAPIQVGLETSRIHQSSPEANTPSLHRSWQTYFHSWEVWYRADEPHGSTWYLEQINAFLANEKERAWLIFRSFIIALWS